MNNFKIKRLSNRIYKEFSTKTEVLRRIIVDNNLIELDNLFIYSMVSFAFHTYFFRILLLSKYSEEDIRKIFIICLEKFLCMIDDISMKNKVVDSINETYDLLDVLMFQVKTAENKEQSVWAMQEIATLFIGAIQKDGDISPDSIAILKITIYFTDLLTDNNFLIKIKA